MGAHRVVELVSAAIRVQQVRGKLGVTGEPFDLPAALGQRLHRPLGRMHRLRVGLVCQPLCKGLLVTRAEISCVEPHRSAVSGSQRHGLHVTGPTAPGARDVNTDPAFRRGEPVSQGARLEHRAGDV